MLAVLELTDDAAKASAEHSQPGNTQLPLSARMIGADTSVQFKENPDAWLLVDKILQEASYPQTKCEPATDIKWYRHAKMLQILVYKSSTMSS